MANYYAVKEGITPGIYKTWDECQAQVKGYKGATYKKFNTEEEAKIFVYGESDSELAIDDSVKDEILFLLTSVIDILNSDILTIEKCESAVGYCENIANALNIKLDQ